MIYSHPERNATEKEVRYIQNWDLHGTRDLGQEVFTALQRGDTGLGVIAGLSSVSDEFGPKYSGIAMPDTKRKRNG